MKRNKVIILMVLSTFCFCAMLNAQTHKKHHKKKRNTVNTDSIVAAERADSMAAAASHAGVAAQPVLDTEIQTPGLVADSDVNNIPIGDLDSTKPKDGFYKVPMLRGAKPFALPKENAYDIRFYKRVWRSIDLRDSMNKVFAAPGETLMALIIKSIQTGKLIAYKDEKFQRMMSYKEVMKALSSDSEVIPQFDSTGAEIGSVTKFKEFNPDSVSRFDLKEDIYFDKVRGRWVSQIIGIAPVTVVKTSQGDYVGENHPFWLYFPQCRIPFAGQDIYDTQRDIYNISFDDIFIQRNFTSMIVKESNPGDLRIKDFYPSDENRQKQEASRIEKQIRDYKVNYWKY